MMPYYYFNLFSFSGDTRDQEGLQLTDLTAARKAAISCIRSLVAEEASEGRIDLRGRIEVTNASGKVLFIVPFDEAVEIVQPARRLKGKVVA
jgi:hypothetical protein